MIKMFNLRGIMALCLDNMIDFAERAELRIRGNLPLESISRLMARRGDLDTEHSMYEDETCMVRGCGNDDKVIWIECRDNRLPTVDLFLCHDCHISASIGMQLISDPEFAEALKG